MGRRVQGEELGLSRMTLYQLVAWMFNCDVSHDHSRRSTSEAFRASPGLSIPQGTDTAMNLALRPAKNLEIRGTMACLDRDGRPPSQPVSDRFGDNVSLHSKEKRKVSTPPSFSEKPPGFPGFRACQKKANLPTALGLRQWARIYPSQPQPSTDLTSTHPR